MAEDKKKEIIERIGECVEKMDPDAVRAFEAISLAYFIGKEAGKKERSKND